MHQAGNVLYWYDSFPKYFTKKITWKCNKVCTELHDKRKVEGERGRENRVKGEVMGGLGEGESAEECKREEQKKKGRKERRRHRGIRKKEGERK